MKSTLKAKLQHVYSKTHSMFALTLFVFFISWIPASQAACSIHDHICAYHVGDATVRAGAAASTGTSLVMYATATNPGTTTASTVDFDTLGKMPANTGDRFLVGSPINYTTPTGPYIINSTAYGTTHPPTTWSTPGDAVLQVAPSQYQLTFNQNTAIAKHTGDFNGGENGNIPGATGCPNMPAGTKNCEAVVVTGNVPNGIYEQKVTLFNYFNAPNPQVQLQVGAYTTGRAVIISNSHESKEQAYFPILSGTGATTPAYQYEVYNLGFDPHAKGTALFDQNKYSTRYSNTYEAGDHRFRDAYFTTLTTHNKVNADGWNDKTYTAKTSVEKQYVGEVVKVQKIIPPITVSIPNFAFTGTNIRNSNLYSFAGSLLQNNQHEVFESKKPTQNTSKIRPPAPGDITISASDLDRFRRFQLYGAAGLTYQEINDSCSHAQYPSACMGSVGLAFMPDVIPVVNRSPRSYRVNATTNQEPPKEQLLPTRTESFRQSASSNLQPISIKINPGQQGKHIPTDNNFIPGRSTLNSKIDPQQLLNGVHAELYPIVGSSSRGDPIVNFGRLIGVDASTGIPTQLGTIHSGKNGAHIVPANPIIYDFNQ